MGEFTAFDERYIEILAVADEVAFRRSHYAPGLGLLRPSIDARAVTARSPSRWTCPTRSLTPLGYQVRELDVELEEFGVSFTEIFVLDGPGRLPFFITYTPTREENLAGYRRARSTREPTALLGITIHTPSPDEAIERMAEVLDIQPDGTTIPLPGAWLRFEQGEQDGIHEVVLSGAGEPDTVDGLRFTFEEPAEDPD